ncbi:MAG TPA: CPBP family intramembrane glutamic endopeptidase [Gemmatimonadales bacterium]
MKRHPALCLGLLAMALGAALLAPAATGLVPPAMMQLAALSASAAGLILAAIEGGRSAVRVLLGRALIWRVGLQWWLFALFFPILPSVATVYLAGAAGRHTVDWSQLPPAYTALPALVFLIVFAGLGEEFGWRGFAVPRLQSRHSALTTSLIIGGFHSLWHLPLFFVKGEMYHTLGLQVGYLPAFLGYGLLVTALAVQLTWIFNNTGGSVLLAAVYHGAGNAWNGYIDIYRGELAGPVAYVALMVVVSVALVVWYGPGTLTRTGLTGGTDGRDGPAATPAGGSRSRSGW